MICLCNNWSVLRLGSRIELGAKTVWKHVVGFFLSFFVCLFWFKNIKLAKKQANGLK